MALSRTTRSLIKQYIPLSSSVRNKTVGHGDDNILKSVYKDVPVLKSSVNDHIWQNLDRWPDKTATVCAVTGHGYTYAQTYKMSNIFAASLRKKLKLGNDDIVSVLLPNIPEYPCTLFGILRAGCIASIMNPVYTASELKRQFQTVNCKAIVASKISYQNIKQALNELNLDVPIILTDYENLPEGAIRFAELAEDVHIDMDCLKSVDRKPDDIAVIPFSSGTTGFPKGVVLTHGSVVALNQMISDPEIVAIRETTATHQSVIPAVLPFYHIFGFNAVMLGQMYFGCKLVTMPHFTPELFIKTIVSFKANVMFLVPPMVLFLAKHPAVTAEHLKNIYSVICGAAPLSVNDAETFVAKCKDVSFRQGHGLTETNGTVSIGRNTDVNYSSVGYPVGSTEVKIVDIDSGKSLGVGQEGEIWYRGRNLMSGYYKDEKSTREVLTEDGWLRTGDVGKYDQNGELYITDRIKELIKVKGFQVAPAELEAILRTNPKIADCAIVGVHDDKLGEVPRAFVVLQPTHTLTEEDVKQFVNEQLIEYKHIKQVTFVESIPKSAAGKILRKDLKAKYC